MPILSVKFEDDSEFRNIENGEKNISCAENCSSTGNFVLVKSELSGNLTIDSENNE